MIDQDRILALPIRALDKSPKRVLFELLDGTRFDLIGGNDRRPLSQGVAGFSPWEMVQVLNWGVPEEAFRTICLLKAKFGGGIEKLEPVT